jgi:Ni/Fe-hydrogenase subunit HybB-like protein
VLPAALLGLFPEARRTRAGLLTGAGLAAFGVALNRFNVSLIGYAPYSDFRYFPSVVELVVTVALIALGILAFDLAGRRLPVYGTSAMGAPAKEQGTT